MNVRDWLYVEDHCSAIDAVLQRGAPGRVYNIGGSEERTNLDIIRTILAEMGKSEKLIRHVPDRPGHDRRYAIDSSRARQELGWQPSYDLDTGIKKNGAVVRKQPGLVGKACLPPRSTSVSGGGGTAVKVMITGAGGRLGGDLQRVLSARHELWAVARSGLDVTDADKVHDAVQSYKPDVIVHAAAYTKVDLAETKAAAAYHVNGFGARNIAEAAESEQAKLVYVSTDYVFLTA